MKSNNHAGLAEKLYKVAVPNGMAYHGGQGVADRQGWQTARLMRYLNGEVDENDAAQ